MTLDEYKKIAKIGDIIKCVDKFGKEWHGQVIDISGKIHCIPIGSQSGVGNWTCEEGDTVYVSENKQKTNLKVMKTGKKLYGDIVINKNKEKISVFIKLPSEIEEWYKTINNGEKEISQTWTDKNGVGVEFYKITSAIREKEKTIYYDSFSDFGKGLINEDSRINLAVLRTVGLTDGVEIFSKNFKNIANAQQEYFVKKLTEFIKKFWEQEISENTLKVRMTFEF